MSGERSGIFGCMGPLRPERCARERIAGGGGGGGGGGVGSISKNRPSHHKYKSPNQFL